MPLQGPSTLVFGCDPEFFFESNGRVIGSEKVIPQDGISIKRPAREFTTGLGNVNSKFVLDGVQVELNPRPHPCRANLGNEIAHCFKQLRDHLKEKGDVRPSFSQVVLVPKLEFDSLCDASKQLGCMPSNNIHGTVEIRVDATKFRTRSAGGHLHLGLPPNLKLHPERLVRLLDVIVGNTCVLLDRDPACAKRRKLYGRAGEYRTPSYGLEYRTLSNFWLRSYQLLSCVTGLARMAVYTLNTAVLKADPINGKYYTNLGDPEVELLDSVDIPKVVKAINTNDFDLAEENFKAVSKFVSKHVDWQDNMAINRGTLPKFVTFYKTIKEKGLEHYFPDDPMTHWCNLPEGHGTGFESFLSKLKEQRV